MGNDLIIRTDFNNLIVICEINKIPKNTISIISILRIIKYFTKCNIGMFLEIYNFYSLLIIEFFFFSVPMRDLFVELNER